MTQPLTTLNRIVRSMMQQSIVRDRLQVLVDELDRELRLTHGLLFCEAWLPELIAPQVSDCLTTWKLFQAQTVSLIQNHQLLLEQGRPLTLSFRHNWLDSNTTTFCEMQECQSLLIVPLRNESYWGAIGLHRDNQEWTIDEIMLVEMLAAQGAIAITQAHLLEQLKAEQAEKHYLETRLLHVEATNRALATIPDLLIRMKRDGTYLEFIPAKTFKTIMPSENMRGVNLWDVMPAYVAQERMKYVEKALLTGEPQLYEYELQIGDECQIQEARIVASGADEVLVIVRDITQRRQTEQERDGLLQQLAQHNQNLEELVAQRTAELVEVNHQLRAEIIERQQIECALRASAERFTRVFEEAPIGMSVHDRQGKVIQVNPALCYMLGYSEAELKTLSFLDYTPSEDLAVEMPLVEQCMQGMLKSYSIEKRYIRKNGDLLWVNLTAFVLRDQKDKVLYRLGMVEDISDRKRIEAQRQKAEAELQASLAEKNILLQEIHHRVKNNLQTVSSLLKLQAGSIRDTHVLAALKESQNRVRSMALIHEKLYQSPSLSQVDFADYIRKFAAELLHSYNGKARSITIETYAEEIELGVDCAIPCGLIMNELVSNAFKYAFPEERSGTIYIQFTSTAPGVYTLMVQDNGASLPADFDLYRPQSLGLQIVVALIRQIHGTLSLNQSNGKAFSITFKNSNAHLGYK